MPAKSKSVKKKAFKATSGVSKIFPKSVAKAVKKCLFGHASKSKKEKPESDFLKGRQKEISFAKNKKNSRWVKKTTPLKKKPGVWKGVSVSATYNWVKPLDDGKINNKLFNWARNATGNKEWLKIGEGNREVSSGAKFNIKDKKGELDLLKAKASFALVEAKAKSESKYHEGEASLKVLSAEGEISVGGEISKKRQELYAKAGGSIDLVKGSVSGGIKIPLWGDHNITFGGTAEGQIGASAEAKAHIGGDKKKGYSLGAKLKLGFGIGAGIGFNIGFK